MDVDQRLLPPESEPAEMADLRSPRELAGEQLVKPQQALDR